MKAYSYDRVLRDVTAPAPNPIARLAAKQAALVEFAQFQALRLERAAQEQDALERTLPYPQHDGNRSASFRRPALVNWLAGAASACIAGLGAILMFSDGLRFDARLRYASLEAKIIQEALGPPPPPKLAMPPPPEFEAMPATDWAASLDEALAADEDRFERFATNPIKRVADEPVSTFSIDVDTASYSYVRRLLNSGVLPPKHAVRAEEMINYFDYSWPSPATRSEAFRATVAVSDSPWTQGNKLVYIGIKGYELPAHEQPDVNLVLLIDVSGSMAQEDKLPLVQRSIELLLPHLKPYDTVAMVTYAGDAGVALYPTPAREQAKILDALWALEAGGSTAGAAGIETAYELAKSTFRQGGVNRVMLATDGDFNVGITSVDELKAYVARERASGIFLSVLGFGQGGYQDELAQALAQNGNGVAAYIDSLSEAEKMLVQESTASLFTIAKDVKLQVEFNPATVEQYRLVGYETRALRREDFDNDAVDAGDIGSGHKVTAIYEITPTASAAGSGSSGVYGDLKIRYKHPDGRRSQLIEQPILINPLPLSPTLQRDVELATAVAGFAQLLRGDPYTGSLTFDDVLRPAEASVGNDHNGYRGEFVELVREAQVLKEASEAGAASDVQNP